MPPYMSDCFRCYGCGSLIPKMLLLPSRDLFLSATRPVFIGSLIRLTIFFLLQKESVLLEG